LEGTIDSLQVRDKTAGFHNDKFSLPSEPGRGLDGSVGVGISVPVTGDKIHVLTDHNPAVVHFYGAAGDIKVFLHVNISRVR